MAWARPCASRMAACRLPSARSTAASCSAPADRTVACALPSATLMAERCWPSDCRMRARFSWSACFCRANAWRIWGGGAISTISIRLMRIPHLSVTASMCCCTSVLMRSRSESASSRLIVPITERSAVRARASMATSKSAMLNSACCASTTWVKIVAFTLTTTLSLVMTSWRSPGRGISRMSTRRSESTNGTMMTRPGSWVRVYSPSRLTTPTSPCWTMLTIWRRAASRTSTSRPRTISATMPKTLMMSLPLRRRAPLRDPTGRPRRSRAPRPSRAPAPAPGSASTTEAAAPSSGQTQSVVPRTAVTTTAVPAGSTSSLPLTASQRSPARRT